MLVSGILIGLTIVAWFIWGKVLAVRFLELDAGIGVAEKERDRLGAEHEGAVRKNSILKRRLDEIIVLYEITKELAKTLDEHTIFESFRQQIDRYVHVKECLFFKGETDLSAYSNHIVLALRLHRQTVGYLIAGGVTQADREKYMILAQQFLLSVKRAILYERLQELSITDTLTGVFTRRHYLERVKEEMEYAKKYGATFAFLMLDIDHFKDYNDHFGHLVGDAILKEVSKVMRENLRQIDLIGRYGGEEFSIMLPQTSEEGAKFAAERIRQSLENRNFKVYDETLTITISIGIAMFGKDVQLDDLLERSDAALYRAKETGRNKVCVDDRRQGN